MSLLLHVFETWSLILREEHNAEVPETKILRNASGSKRGKARRGWINFQNEQSRVCIIV